MRIAIADKNPVAINLLKEVTEGMGHHVTIFQSAAPLITQLQRDTYDLLFLNWTISDGSGRSVLNWVQQNVKVPPAIIMVTDTASKKDIAAALHAGADDYIVMPEDDNVVEARIAALLRRCVSRASADGPPQFFGRYCFDRHKQTALLNGEEIPLTSKEFTLALLFFHNEQRALSRAYIMNAVWHSVADLPSRTLDMHVSRIRSKLQLKPENGFRLFTVFGYGYRLERME
ncbi:response regulator transcription factor [Rhizorhapis sp. SPR117]|uniref:response regulator transcription factor n=1 Tax=Rhizorhapis sp. SPR117 TaxID=2912611 RepID=UPI001F44208B|nr:response regulator transcription factor [Rhizorhapis sp. SPR117]